MTMHFKTWNSENIVKRRINDNWQHRIFWTWTRKTKKWRQEENVFLAVLISSLHQILLMPFKLPLKPSNFHFRFPEFLIPEIWFFTPVGCRVVPKLKPLFSCRYDFASLPIAHPRHKRDFSNANPEPRRLTAFTRADLILNSSGTN